MRSIQRRRSSGDRLHDFAARALIVLARLLTLLTLQDGVVLLRIRLQLVPRISFLTRCGLLTMLSART
jgi:hypothetical protein